MTTKFSRDTTMVPKAACQMVMGQLAADGESDDYLFPVKMAARSSQPIDHWYWGKVAHDFDGMQMHKPRLTIDYAHDDAEVVGFLDKFKVTPEGLSTSGALVKTPNKTNDMAAEVAHKMSHGVPYEASIDFSDTVEAEMVEEGATVQVNGQEFAGPGIVIRKWSLRGVAVCPYGADKNTSTMQFTDGDQVAVIVTGEEDMAGEATNEVLDEHQEPQPQSETQSETQTPAEVPADPPVDTTFSKDEAAKFFELFGEQGLKWHVVDGLSLEECHKLHKESLEAENKRLKDQLAAAKDAGAEDEATEFDGKGQRNGRSLPIRMASN